VIFERQALSRTLASALLVVAGPAYCGTSTWTGTTSGDWNDSSNWGGTLPSAGNDLLFNVLTNTGSMNNDFVAGTGFHSLTLNTGGTVSLSGNTIDIGAGGITQMGVTKLNDFAHFTLTATQAWTSSAPGSIGLNGGAALDLGANTLTLMGSGDDFFDQTISGTGGLMLAGSVKLELAGTPSFSGTTTVSGSANLILESLGTINTPIVVGSGATLTIVPGLHPLTNASVSLQAGSTLAMKINGSATINDYSSLGANANVTLAGGLSVSSSTVLASGAVVTIIATQSGGTVSGTFSGIPDGATVRSGVQYYVVHYTATAVTLTAQDRIFVNGFDP
jgi:fibronectin-binding autotransporter adhesin